MSDDAREILYLADPMCSWCWGFSPVIDTIREKYGGRVPIRLVVGGLRVGTTEVMNDSIKETVLHHWREVNKLTGQEFCYDFAMPDGFVYDTEPSCRATVVVRSIDSEVTFPYFKALHKAFYVDNKDVTSEDVLRDIAADFDIEAAAFSERFNADESRRETMEDVAFTAGVGVRGFPSIVLKSGDNYGLLTYGYQSYDVLEPLLEKWMAKTDDEP